MLRVRDVQAAQRALTAAGQPAEMLRDGSLALNDAASVEHPEVINRLLVTAGTPPTQLIVEEEALEQYFLRLGEQGEEVRTNFSDLPDEEIAALSWWAITELGAQNVVRHPHTGEVQPRRAAVRGATRADL